MMNRITERLFDVLIRGKIPKFRVQLILESSEKFIEANLPGSAVERNAEIRYCFSQFDRIESRCNSRVSSYQSPTEFVCDGVSFYLSPALMAISKRNLPLVKMLDEHGFDKPAHETNVPSRLFMACMFGPIEVARYFLSKGDDANLIFTYEYKDKSDNITKIAHTTSLIAAILVANDSGLVRELLLNGANPALANSDNQTALQLAKEKNSECLPTLRCFKNFEAAKKAVNDKNPALVTMHLAKACDHDPEFVVLLLGSIINKILKNNNESDYPYFMPFLKIAADIFLSPIAPNKWIVSMIQGEILPYLINYDVDVEGHHLFETDEAKKKFLGPLVAGSRLEESIRKAPKPPTQVLEKSNAAAIMVKRNDSPIMSGTDQTSNQSVAEIKTINTL